MKILFLGTGGGHDMMIAQVRKTGGIFFDLEKVKFVLDPGPGSLVHAISLGLQPEKWNGVLLSHLHPDHASDVNAYLDGMTSPFLVAEEHCLIEKKKLERGKAKKGDFDYHPCVTVYHQEKSQVHPVRDGSTAEVAGLRISAVKAAHYIPTVGFRISGEANGQTFDIGYTSDGQYYKGMEKHYDGCKVLIINVVIPKGGEAKRPGYMSVDGIISLLNAMKQKPRLVILTHFSFWFMRSNLWKQEKIIQDATKVRTIHAEDFMTLDLATLQASQYKESKKS
ncbi:MAG: hypothetical protein J4400_05775 [Candidatus Aenigmarchaeota archaeon]|nr:hypothetical protein [Candidatus Aenigmarchaeota archaeon]